MDDNASEDERTIELSSIQAIFPELAIDPSDPYTATLELPVTPVKPLRIQFSKAADDSAPAPLPTPPTSDGRGQEGKQPVGMPGKAAEDQTETHELEHLPPLKLSIHLHDRYPAEEPPKVTISVTPPWLPRSKIQELIAICAQLWEEIGRDQVVFSYIDHLQQQAEVSFELGIDGKPASMPSDIKLVLLDYDLKTKRKVFEAETFDCGICLEPKKGKDCHRMISCRHVFCTACLQDFYNNAITEGDVDAVKCLNPGCGKEAKGSERPTKRQKRDRTLNPSELLQIPIEQTLVQRYVKLKRKKRLESDKDTIYCPRQWCQAPARSKKHPKPGGEMDDFSESDSEPEVPPPPTKDKVKPEDIPMSQRLAVCEDCSFAFCIVCKKGWHGEMTICNPRRKKEVDAEELASLDYMKRFSTPCPTCSAPAQKTMGCNHMICFKCKTHFCYLCSAYLMPDNPYKHYNEFKSTCYMRLWELEGGDGEGAGYHFHGIGGGGGWEEEFEAQEEEENEVIVGAPIMEQEEEEEDDDDSEDEEPAPHIRPRERAIEFVNFARGNQAQRIILPDEPVAVPPPAPVPPQPRGVRRRRARQRNVQPVVGQRQAPVEQAVDPDARLLALMRAVEAINAGVDVDDPANPAEPIVLPRAAPGQGNADGNQPAPARAMGLERFLELAQNDREDEWDSDELDEDDEDDRELDRVDMARIEGRERALLGMNRGRGRGMGQL